MKAASVSKLLEISKPTLLKRIQDTSLLTEKTSFGENIFRWKHIFKLRFLQKYGNLSLGPKIISIAQNKGGVGKTTSVINLATAFSYLGKTLIVDLDSQANLSQAFKIYLTKYEDCIADVLDAPERFKDIVVNVAENLDLVPSSLKLEKWKKNHKGDSMAPFALKRVLKSIKENYNFILIDTPPALDISLETALYASDYCLIPIEPHPFSFDGISNIMEEIEFISSNDNIANFNLKILGCFINMYEQNPMTESIANSIKENYPTFEAKIRKAISLTQAQVVKQSIFEFEENSNVSHDFYHLVFELLDKITREV
jgi:chromosome partitioning protein